MKLLTFKMAIVTFIFIGIIKVEAQNFDGVATYKSHRKMDFNIKDEDENSELKKQLHEQLKKQFQREYTLEFNREESIYKKVEELDKPMPVAGHGMKITISEGSDILYKNLKENRYSNQTELLGKVFTIKDSMRSNDWELINETKNIGNYTCFKAQFTKDYEIKKLTAEGEIEVETKERTTVAWYTPQIPIPNGPQNFQGLPGLILEINDGELTLVCSKIVLNPEESIHIEEPDKGKVVSQAEYDKIQKEKNDEMMERMRSRQKDGENVIISVRG